jgi:hypothetical protein
LPVKPGSHTPAQLLPALVDAQVGGKRPLLREAPGVPRHTVGKQTRPEAGRHVGRETCWQGDMLDAAACSADRVLVQGVCEFSASAAMAAGDSGDDSVLYLSPHPASLAMTHLLSDNPTPPLPNQPSTHTPPPTETPSPADEEQPPLKVSSIHSYPPHLMLAVPNSRHVPVHTEPQ